jgi:hypothetical protein
VAEPPARVRAPGPATAPLDRRFLGVASVAGAIAIGIVAMAVDALARGGAFGPVADALWVTVYRQDAAAILAGQLPYRDLALEYPPLSLPVFVLPALVAGTDPEAYRVAFEALIAACGMAAMPVVAVTVARLGGRRADVGWALGLVAAAPLLAGPIVLTRYDLWPALLAATAVAALVHDRHRTAHAVLALAVLAKVYPAELAPLFVAWTWRRAGPAEAVRAAAVGLAVGLAGLAPFLALAPGAAIEPFVRTLARPLQIESLGASILIALRDLVGLDPGRVTFTFESFNLEGELASRAALVQSAALLAALAAIWLVGVIRPPTPSRLVLAGAAALGATVALDKVLSTQFVVWLLPAVAVLAPVRGLRPLVGLAVICGLTNLYYPGLYRALVDGLAPGPAALLVARNLLLVALAADLGLAAWADRTGAQSP